MTNMIGKKLTSKYSLEYLSLHYLNLWLKHDKPYYEAITLGSQSEKLKAINKALAFYKVARNLPTKYDIEKNHERYEPILKIIDAVDSSDFSNDVVWSIEKVQKKISRAYGDRGVLSITTKLLWLKVRDPIIIYDSQARKALGTEDGNLSAFYNEWRNQYELHRKEILSACAKLSNVAKYSCDMKISTPKYIDEISSSNWFQERVFDVYLWHKGL